MIQKIKINYNTFLDFKKHKYDTEYIKTYIAKELHISKSNIDDVDFNYKLTFDIYINDDLKTLQKNYQNYMKGREEKNEAKIK